MNTQLGDDPRAISADEFEKEDTMSYVEFNFNTALAGVSADNGKFDEKAFEELAKKIRGYVMAKPSGDGISGMRITRYEIHVDYESGATTREKIAAAIEAAVAWAADSLEGAFPLREDKVPAAISKVYIKEPTGETAVTAKLRTNLYRHPFNEQESVSIRRELVTALVDLDGVRGCRTAMNGVSLDISDEVTTPDVTKAHVQKVLQAFADDPNSPYLPFAKSNPVDIEWEVTQYMR